MKSQPHHIRELLGLAQESAQQLQVKVQALNAEIAIIGAALDGGTPDQRVQQAVDALNLELETALASHGWTLVPSRPYEAKIAEVRLVYSRADGHLIDGLGATRVAALIDAWNRAKVCDPLEVMPEPDLAPVDVEAARAAVEGLFASEHEWYRNPVGRTLFSKNLAPTSASPQALEILTELGWRVEPPTRGTDPDGLWGVVGFSEDPDEEVRVYGCWDHADAYDALLRKVQVSSKKVLNLTGQIEALGWGIRAVDFTTDRRVSWHALNGGMVVSSTLSADSVAALTEILKRVKDTEAEKAEAEKVRRRVPPEQATAASILRVRGWAISSPVKSSDPANPYMVKGTRRSETLEACGVSPTAATEVLLRTVQSSSRAVRRRIAQINRLGLTVVMPPEFVEPLQVTWTVQHNNGDTDNIVVTGIDSADLLTDVYQKAKKNAALKAKIEADQPAKSPFPQVVDLVTYRGTITPAEEKERLVEGVDPTAAKSELAETLTEEEIADLEAKLKLSVRDALASYDWYQAETVRSGLEPVYPGAGGPVMVVFTHVSDDSKRMVCAGETLFEAYCQALDKVAPRLAKLAAEKRRTVPHPPQSS